MNLLGNNPSTNQMSCIPIDYDRNIKFETAGIYEISFKIREKEKKINITVFDEIPKPSIRFDYDGNVNKSLIENDINLAYAQMNYRFHTLFNFTKYAITPSWMMIEYSTGRTYTSKGEAFYFTFYQNHFYIFLFEINKITYSVSYYFLAFNKFDDYQLLISPSHVVSTNENVNISTTLDRDAIENCMPCKDFMFSGFDKDDCNQLENEYELYCNFRKNG